MSTVVETEPLPKLGVADLDTTELPHLEVVVRNAKLALGLRASCRFRRPCFAVVRHDCGKRYGVRSSR